MSAALDTAHARRYLLGDLSEDERELIEQAYFDEEDLLQRMEAAEDDLIEDYLSNQLPAAEREQFEQRYLSNPRHRVRVETVRRLMAHAARAESAPSAAAVRPIAQHPRWRGVRRHAPWLALAATLLIITVVALLRFSAGDDGPQEQIVEQQPPPPTSPPPTTTLQPTVYAVTISPGGVRSGSESPIVVIPSGADILHIRLQADADSRRLAATRAVIHTVAGAEQWRGPVVRDGEAPPGVVARLDVTASRLPADDYVVTLFGTDSAGAEREWARYFLPIRAQ